MTATYVPRTVRERSAWPAAVAFSVAVLVGGGLVCTVLRQDPIPAFVIGSPSPSITPSGPTSTPGPLLVVVATEPPTPTPSPTATKTPQTYCGPTLKPGTLCVWPPKVEVTTPIPVSTCTATAYPGLSCRWMEGA